MITMRDNKIVLGAIRAYRVKGVKNGQNKGIQFSTLIAYAKRYANHENGSGNKI
jgi:hypothetical protein